MNVRHVRIEMKPHLYAYPDRDIREVQIMVQVDDVKHSLCKVMPSNDLESHFDWLMREAVDELRHAITKPAVAQS